MGGGGAAAAAAAAAVEVAGAPENAALPLGPNNASSTVPGAPVGAAEVAVVVLMLGMGSPPDPCPSPQVRVAEVPMAVGGFKGR